MRDVTQFESRVYLREFDFEHQLQDAIEVGRQCSHLANMFVETALRMFWEQLELLKVFAESCDELLFENLLAASVKLFRTIGSTYNNYVWLYEWCYFAVKEDIIGYFRSSCSPRNFLSF